MIISSRMPASSELAEARVLREIADGLLVDASLPEDVGRPDIIV
jgi:hypothetical protein